MSIAVSRAMFVLCALTVACAGDPATSRPDHYYGAQGVIFITSHPTDVPSRIYAAAREALGKQPDEGPAAAMVTGIVVVQPFAVTKAAERQMVRQQVISTRPETTLRSSVEY